MRLEIIRVSVSLDGVPARVDNRFRRHFRGVVGVRCRLRESSVNRERLGKELIIVVVRVSGNLLTRALIECLLQAVADKIVTVGGNVAQRGVVRGVSLARESPSGV